MKKDITLNTFTREFYSERPCLEFLIDKKKIGLRGSLAENALIRNLLRASNGIISDAPVACTTSELQLPASLEGALNKMAEHGSVLTTDRWRGCVSAVHNHWHDVADSTNGENFKLLHWHIFNLKN
jgi:hypothetical protein